MGPPEDKPGFFRDLQQEGYYLSEYFGEGTDAGQMPLEVADRIIRDCTGKFLEAMRQRGESQD